MTVVEFGPSYLKCVRSLLMIWNLVNALDHG